MASQEKWHDISSEMLMAETKDVARALTERLGDQGTFFKDSDTDQVMSFRLLTFTIDFWRV